MKIGEKIKQRRLELGWSQRDLAAKMDYDHSTIGRIERGIIDMPQSKIVQFSDVLGVSIAHLMGWDEEMKKDPVGMAEKHIEIIMDEDISDIFDDFKKLDAKEKAMVKQLIHTMACAKLEG